MKLLYTGGSFCDEATFKRLFLIANEVSFMDRPSVTFGGKWGTIGHDSPLRVCNFDGAVVKVRVHAPPSGPAKALYEPYALADFSNAQFIQIVRDGLRNDPIFAQKFIHQQADYGNGLTGKQILDAVNRAIELSPMPLEEHTDPRLMYDIGSLEGVRCTFKTIMAEASIHVTSAFAVADEVGAVPVSTDPYLLRLLALRASDRAYVGGTTPYSWWLGLQFATAVIPDKAPQQLSFLEINKYREKTLAAHTAWTTDLNRTALGFEELTPDEVEREIPKLVLTELEPKIQEYKAEMAGIRDDLFADVLKSVVDWKVPSLTFASYVTMGYAPAVTAFATSFGRAVGGPVVDFWKAKRRARRKHAVSYLLGLSKK